MRETYNSQLILMQQGNHCGYHGGVNQTTNTMNNNHPIELFLAALLYMVEGVCWIINEIAGHHTEQVTEQVKPHVQPLHEALTELTVKQLRTLTGVTSSRYRKADLVMLAAVC